MPRASLVDRRIPADSCSMTSAIWKTVYSDGVEHQIESELQSQLSLVMSAELRWTCPKDVRTGGY